MGNKKLLIMGANYESIPLIQTALNRGLEVHVADHLKNSKGKHITGVVPVDIDGTDVASLAFYCEENDIRSVMVGVADRLVRSYAALCQRLSIFCLSSIKTAEILSNKSLFNGFLEQNNLDYIENFTRDKAYAHIQDGKKVIVKPSDGNSGKGLSVCSSTYEINRAIKFAKENSRSGEILIEPYLEDDGIGIYMTFSNFRCIDILVYDRFTAPDDLNMNKVPIAGIYPSKYTSLFMEKYSQNLTAALCELNIECGALMISGFITDTELRLYDPGFRLQGEGSDVIVQHRSNIDQLEGLISFATTGSFDQHAATKIDTKSYASIWLLVKEGEICSVSGLDELKTIEGVVEVRQRLVIGDIVNGEQIGTEGQVFARIYICAEFRENLEKISDLIFKIIKVVDGFGENLLIKSIDSEFWSINGK